MGELCLLGYPIMTIPVWDKFFLWPFISFKHIKIGYKFFLWPFISFKHIKLGKSRYTRRFIPTKVSAHPPSGR